MSPSPVKDSGTAPELEALGRYALRYVKPGQLLGLGTGRAASAFIQALADARREVRGVSTSKASAELARSLGLQLVELKDVGRLAADFDGADEVDPRLQMIKGLGGAMVREKVVAMSSRRRIFLIGEEKLVKRLGEHGNLPIEVVPFALPYVSRELTKAGLKPKTRAASDGSEFVSDNGNRVIDCAVREIRNPARLERELLAISGVVGTGLFIGIADLVLVAMRDGAIKTLRASAR
jgi:ribose 5-phosphate isomerase A